MLRLPGLIDPHVHLRDMGQIDKEDFLTGTTAALAGGFTTVLDMPNNSTPITTLERLKEKIKIAKEKVVCDIGFHFGSLGDNLNEFEKVKDRTIGLKLFLNETTGNYLLNESKLEEIFRSWPKEKVILFHAEEEKIDLVIKILKVIPRPVHICHISTKKELEKIIQAKENNLSITCGVTPHHLFLTERDITTLKGFGVMKPTLKTQEDKDFLWKYISAIDCIESDHAPHTKEEKESQTPHFGVPGLETTLPLLLTAMYEKKLTIEQITKLCYENAKRIFMLPHQPNTYIEVDETEEYEVKNENLHTKCQWSPFDGWKVRGRIRKITLRGVNVIKNNELLTTPGSGKILTR